MPRPVIDAVQRTRYHRHVLLYLQRIVSKQTMTQKLGSGQIYHPLKNIFVFCSRIGGFWHLMLRWKGSVFKLIWHDLLIFVLLYMALGVLYRWILYDNEVYRELFELVCIYSSRQNLLSLNFSIRLQSNSPNNNGCIFRPALAC